MKGIFFSLSSFIAMSSGSDSPFSSTITGAFMLHHTFLLVALVPLAAECTGTFVQRAPAVLHHQKSCSMINVHRDHTLSARLWSQGCVLAHTLSCSEW